MFREQREKNDDVIQRLSGNAGHIIAMLKDVFHTSQGLDYWKALLYASGLAGYACHQAVKAEQGSFALVETSAGKKFFFGDDVNKYLLEDRYSVLCFMNGIYQHICPGKEAPDIQGIIKNAVSDIGNGEYKIWNVYIPEEAFKAIKSCWDGIYENMTSQYCKKPSEWPTLYGIVLQNIMSEAMKVIPPENVYIAALECALYISKMDMESL